ncbi:MAG: response regulator [Methanomicrobiaceae archaeon]|nr:response regulator [Methanomicrobiaceae archaeon]
MMNVLIVDDDEGILDITRIFLEKTGRFNVTAENSAKAALGMLKSGEFDAVVSDYEMPEMNGIEFLKCVRNSGNNIPFIIFTGRGREDVVIEALNCGVDSYIQKGGDLKSQFAELTHRISTAVEKKRAESELIEANEYSKCLIEAHVDPLVTIDCNGIIDDVNNSMEEMAGYSRERLIGMPFYSFFKDPEEVKKALDLVLSDEEICDYPLVLKTRKKDSVPVFFFATLYHTGNSRARGNSRVKGIFAELHYAGEENIAEFSEKEQKNSDLCLDILTHDIKNALCTGYGYCDILEGMKEMQAGSKEYLKKTEGCFKRIERTLNCINCLKSIKSQEFSPGPVSLDKIMEKETRCYSQVKINYAGCGLHVMADSLLGSVFENIFGNSIKYADPDSDIGVRVSDEGSYVKITVEDSSSGMPAEIMKKLSDGEFINKKPAGYEGFGLYIISSLVNRYGGKVYANERIKDGAVCGTSLVFTLNKAEEADCTKIKSPLAIQQPL